MARSTEQPRSIVRFAPTVGYALLLAVAAFALQWLEYRYVSRLFTAELYISLIAVGFLILGVWLGTQWRSADWRRRFQHNGTAQRELGISERELTVLELLSSGQSNKEIARSLKVSPNTVKTHVSRVFGKLNVARRTQAVNQARKLGLIP
ncbi:MAG: response regulator transcription factor [Pseudomonadota bacterium]